MVDEKFRKALDAYVDNNKIQEKYGNTLILDNHAYDKSIMGISSDGILIYDYNKMIQEFAEDENCDELEAIEWLEYNTLRAVPYWGSRHPIIRKTKPKNLQGTRASLLKKYGGD